METQSGSDASKYQEALPEKLRGQYKEVEITGSIKEWNNKVSLLMEPEDQEVTLETTRDGFNNLPLQLRELMDDLHISAADAPTIKLTKPYENRGFSIIIDPKSIHDEVMGITLNVGYSGKQPEVRYINHTGQEISTSTKGYGDISTPVVEKYFTYGDQKQGDYSLSTSNLTFFHEKKIDFINAVLPWFASTYNRRNSDLPKVLREAREIVNNYQEPEDSSSST